MIRPQFDKNANTRIKSFLSPFRYGIRSVSTSDSHANLSTAIQSQKSYLDFRRIKCQKPSTTKSNLRIRLQDFSKKQNKKQNKLIKFTMNRNKQKEYTKDFQIQQELPQKESEQNTDVLYLIRKLKEKVIELQSENKKLRQLQESDHRKILKQDQIIRNLEEALYITRGHASYSLGSFYKQNRPQVNCSRILKPEKDVDFKILSASFENRIEQLTQENRKLQQKCLKLQNQLKIFEKNEQKIQNPSKQGCKTCKLINITSLQQLLKQIQIKKHHQMQEINSLLFEACNSY